MNRFVDRPCSKRHWKLGLVALLLSGSVLADETAERLATRVELLARPEIAAGLASFSRNLYEALIERGFGHDEAMRLVVAFAAIGTEPAECRSAP